MTLARAHRGKADGRYLRQHRVRSREVDAHAVEGPHLNHEIRIRWLEGRREEVAHRLVAQNERRLPQVIVEERVRLGEGVAIDDRAAHGADAEYGTEQPGEQPRAQRAHGCGRTR